MVSDKLRKINKPTLNPKDVYSTCICNVRNAELKGRLEAVVEHIGNAAEEYDSKAKCSCLYHINQHDTVCGVSKVEMEDVYTKRMAKKGSAGRHIYDELKAATPHGICPLCGHRQVSQLDHYLPKANFPSFAVVPFNLVPSCSDCNKIKLNDVPKDPESQMLHPYYDDVIGIQWLYADIEETTPATFHYIVKTPPSLNLELKNRIQNHFDKLKLGDLYCKQAANELAGKRHCFNEHFCNGGSSALREELLREERSWRALYENSWQTAMYQAMATSQWFYNGGFSSFD